jgi:hypothetical protein
MLLTVTELFAAETSFVTGGEPLMQMVVTDPCTLRICSEIIIDDDVDPELSVDSCCVEIPVET